MKQVVRYKCDYCKKMYARAETTEKHEKECVCNPEAVNCLFCKHSYIGGYDIDYPPRTVRDVPMCDYHQESLGTLKRGFSENGYLSHAPYCDEYARAKEPLYARDGKIETDTDDGDDVPW